MEKLFELEDELKALTLEGVNTDKALDLLHEFIGGLSIGENICNIQRRSIYWCWNYERIIQKTT